MHRMASKHRVGSMGTPFNALGHIVAGHSPTRFTITLPFLTRRLPLRSAPAMRSPAPPAHWLPASADSPLSVAELGLRRCRAPRLRWTCTWAP